MTRAGRIRLAVGLVPALAALAIAAPSPGGPARAAEPPSVVLVGPECAVREFICPAFTRAARRTGTRARIVSPDSREDITATFVLLGRQGHDLVIGDPDFGFQLADAASRARTSTTAMFGGRGVARAIGMSSTA